MFGNIAGALFFLVVVCLPRGRKVEVCSVVEWGGMPYIWDRCSSPDLFRGQRPNRPNTIWGVTYPATYVKGEKYPFIGEDLGMWGATHTFVELCQYGSPALCIIPPPCTSMLEVCVMHMASMDEELPIVEFAARMGCEEADEAEEQPLKLSSHRASLLVTHEWDHCRHCRGRGHTGMDTNRMTRDRQRQSARRIKAELLGC